MVNNYKRIKIYVRFNDLVQSKDIIHVKPMVNNEENRIDPPQVSSKL